MRVNIHLYIHENPADATGEKIMTAISDFAAQQREFNSRIATGIGNIKVDLVDLLAKVAELQGRDTLSPEDKELLTAIAGEGQALTERVEALDAENPPSVPT